MKLFPTISVVVPLHNEESNVAELLKRTLTVLDSMPGGPHELVLVDDGSVDHTLEMIEQAAETDPRIVVVVLSRNFGHQAALGAALDVASGDAVVTMDGDLQDAPEYIPEFAEELRRGYDVVYAERIKRKEGALWRYCYQGFYWLIAELSDVAMPQEVGDFGMMSRRVVDILRGSPERHLYWRGLRSWAGFRQKGVPVERDARHAGKSKYSLRKLLQLAFDGIFSFSIVPLRAASFCGALAIVLSIGFSAYSVFAKLFLAHTPRGFTALFVGITFLTGIQLLFLGIIGEYVGRIYEQVKLRPRYIVSRIIGQKWTQPTRADTEISTKDIGGGVPERPISLPLSNVTSGGMEETS
jgi:glycosyltransferase involved in cell wall biosynthesis